MANTSAAQPRDAVAPVPYPAGPLGDSAVELADEARRQRARATIELLNQWSTEDPIEQRDTWEYLQRVLDEDRLSSRKRFP